MTGSADEHDMESLVDRLRRDAGQQWPYAAESERFAGLLAAALGRPVPVLMISAHAHGIGVMVLASDLAELIERAAPGAGG